MEKYLSLFEEITNDVEGVRLCKEKLQGYLAPEAADSLEMIITSVESQKEAEFKMSLTRRLCGECLIIQEQSLRFPWMNSAEASAEADVMIR